MAKTLGLPSEQREIKPFSIHWDWIIKRGSNFIERKDERYLSLNGKPNLEKTRK